MSKVISNEECDCFCHNYNNIAHIVPCCHICPRCGLRVRSGFIESHMIQHFEEEE